VPEAGLPERRVLWLREVFHVRTLLVAAIPDVAAGSMRGAGWVAVG
jgi:hypothetical protein